MSSARVHPVLAMNLATGASGCRPLHQANPVLAMNLATGASDCRPLHQANRSEPEARL